MPRASTMQTNNQQQHIHERPTRHRSRLHIALLLLLVFGFLILVAVGVAAVSEPVEARFPINNFSNIDDTATVTPNGTNIGVSGWVKCTEGEIAEVRVTVTQDSVDADGTTRVRCLGLTAPQTWTIHVSPTGPDSFDVERSVHVDAWAVPRAQGDRTDDPHEWTNEDVELVTR